MKSTRIACLLALLGATCSVCIPATAQNILNRLESGIRQANGEPAATTPPATAPVAEPVTPPATAAPNTPAAAPKVYLGAIAIDEAGGGVRITGVRGGGPAQRAGLRTQDLVVGLSGKPIQRLSELTDTLSGMKPGDRVPLEVIRGVRRMRVSVVLGTPLPPGATEPRPSTPPADGPSPPPPTGLGAGRTETIPSPPGDLNAAQKEIVPAPPSRDMPLPSPADGPALSVPAQPVAPNSPQAQIEELRRDVEQLKRRVQELEKALAEAQKK
jgi:hypothetical protein